MELVRIATAAYSLHLIYQNYLRIGKKGDLEGGIDKPDSKSKVLVPNSKESNPNREKEVWPMGGH